MKKLFFLSLIISFLIVSAPLYAAEKAPLGFGNLAVKVDYINFTENDMEDLDVDKGLYLGLEGYGEIVPNLYLGMEVGYTKPDGKVHAFIPELDVVRVDTEFTYIPVELNLKYAIPVNPFMVIDLGAGLSYNYAKIEISADGISGDDDDWLFGGQFFTDIVFKMGQVFVSLNGKYQITEDIEINDFDTDVNANNWRVGGQIGIMF